MNADITANVTGARSACQGRAHATTAMMDNGTSHQQKKKGCHDTFTHPHVTMSKDSLGVNTH